MPYTVGFDAEAAKIASLNLLKKEGVKLRLHSWVVAPDARRRARNGRHRALQVRPAGHRRRHRH